MILRNDCLQVEIRALGAELHSIRTPDGTESRLSVSGGLAFGENRRAIHLPGALGGAVLYPRFHRKHLSIFSIGRTRPDLSSKGPAVFCC